MKVPQQEADRNRLKRDSEAGARLDAHGGTPDALADRSRRMLGPTAQVLIASAAAIPFAIAFPELAVRLETLSDLFVRALTLIVIPLIATLLITSFVELAERRSSQVVYWLLGILIFGTLLAAALGLLFGAIFGNYALELAR